ncbi:MAG: right-handed parallel beta-helix repeat-containing protein [Phycisphaerales bacterium]|jgi:hypothetical protein|nr:right-handed parallel beta-helix repeat-containing protein [Phycisphaerales bacterium]
MRFSEVILSCILGCTALAEARSIRVPDDAATIQAAIDAAVSGDRIIVGAGTYREAIDLRNRTVVLDGEAGPSRTVIDASGIDRPAVTIAGGKDDAAALRGFKIIGGTGDRTRFGEEATIGGGLLIKGCAPVIENCWIVGNVTTYEGGGAWIGEDAAPRFIRCRVTSNRSERGGGVFVHASQCTFTDCRFTSNQAVFGGGGLAADAGSRVRVIDGIFKDCGTTYNGGGVYVYSSLISLERCTFIQNAAGGAGGAVYQGYNSRVDTKDVDYRTFGDSVFGEWHESLSPPKGACCIDSMCIEVTERACLDASGRWSGPETDCIAVLAAACPVPQPGDLNGDSAVDIRDMAILMSLWGDGGTTESATP